VYADERRSNLVFHDPLFGKTPHFTVSLPNLIENLIHLENL
jgi:hypothetical protein